MLLTRISICGILLVVLTGCASNHANVTDYRLCYKLATLPSYNINTSARQSEVNSRGLDCSVYAERINSDYSAMMLKEAESIKNYNSNITIQQPKLKNDTVICTAVGNNVFCN